MKNYKLVIEHKGASGKKLAKTTTWLDRNHQAVLDAVSPLVVDFLEGDSLTIILKCESTEGDCLCVEPKTLIKQEFVRECNL